MVGADLVHAWSHGYVQYIDVFNLLLVYDGNFWKYMS